MKVTTIRKPAPVLFASVRGSRDLSLAAFAIALLAAFALHAGAFLPQLSPAVAPGERAAVSAAVASAARTPAPLATKAAAPAPDRAAVAASGVLPCGAPRG